MPGPLRVLIVEDIEVDAILLLRELKMTRLTQDFRNVCGEQAVRFCHIRGDIIRDEAGVAIQLQDVIRRMAG
jgi:hypothetical protein